MTQIAADPDFTVKSWLIGWVGPDAHVAFKFPRPWNLTDKPVIVVQIINETSDVPSSVMIQFDVWATRQENAAGLKSRLVEALEQLNWQHYQVAGSEIAGAYNTTTVWLPDTAEAVRGSDVTATPRYVTTSTLTIGSTG